MGEAALYLAILVKVNDGRAMMGNPCCLPIMLYTDKFSQKNTWDVCIDYIRIVGK